MRPMLVEAPQGVLVSVEELRDETRIDGTDQDAKLLRYERAVVALLDGYTGRLGRCILRQKWALPLIDKPEAVFLPFPDCRDFAVEQLQSDDTWTTVEGVGFQHDRDYVVLNDLPSDMDDLFLTCWAGWENADAVPANLTNAVRWLVSYWHDNPAMVSDDASARRLPAPFEAMIAPLVHVFG